MAWRIIYHDERFQQAILGLPNGIMARFFHCTETEKTPLKEMELALRRLKEWKDADA
jgi:hypothetical protein